MSWHCNPTLATVALSVQHPWVLAWRGNESPGCPPALVGTSGYSWQQLPLPVAVVTMTQLPAFLLSHGHAGPGTHTLLWVGAAPAAVSPPCPRSPPTFNGAAAH